MADTGTQHWAQTSARHRNVGDAERRWSLAGGALTALAGLRRGGALGALLAGLGAILVYRGATGSCGVYRLLGRSTASSGDQGLLGRGTAPRMRAAVTIEREPMELYEQWREFSNLARFMRHIEEVRVLSQQRSHWIAEVPMASRLEWESEVTADVPGERIAWRSVAGSEIDTEGEVRFRAGSRGTEVQVEMSYQPPGGAVGAAAARMARTVTETMLKEDLRRFKQLMENDASSAAAGEY